MGTQIKIMQQTWDLPTSTQAWKRVSGHGQLCTCGAVAGDAHIWPHLPLAGSEG